ncbi:hypothetical protein ACOME3_002847 [Neoechinorhynchus agilis]
MKVGSSGGCSQFLNSIASDDVFKQCSEFSTPGIEIGEELSYNPLTPPLRRDTSTATAEQCEVIKNPFGCIRLSPSQTKLGEKSQKVNSDFNADIHDKCEEVYDVLETIKRKVRRTFVSIKDESGKLRYLSNEHIFEEDMRSISFNKQTNQSIAYGSWDDDDFYYPAKIITKMPNNQFELLCDDGFKRTIDSNRIIEFSFLKSGTRLMAQIRKNVFMPGEVIDMVTDNQVQIRLDNGVEQLFKHSDILFSPDQAELLNGSHEQDNISY